MDANDRCPACDRPEATAEQWSRVERDENIPAAEGASVCWGEGEPQCLTARVDWRARALAAEAQRDEARRLLAAAACGKLRRCETCGERIATRRWRGTDVDVCDRCFDEDKRDAADGWETLDEEACEDLPYAAALRAAIEGAPREAPDATLTVRPAATQAERDRDLISALAGALLVERAVAAEYVASEGRPWAERIAVRKRLDAARAAVQARMAEGGR